MPGKGLCIPVILALRGGGDRRMIVACGQVSGSVKAPSSEARGSV